MVEDNDNWLMFLNPEYLSLIPKDTSKWVDVSGGRMSPELYEKYKLYMGSKMADKIEEAACGCKIIDDGDLNIQWAWPCPGHGPGYKCEAINYLPGYKLHGCVKVKCKVCEAEYCPHWPKCPKCLLKALEG